MCASLPNISSLISRRLVLILEEPARVAVQIGTARSADHLERRQLQRRRLEPGLIGHHRRRLVLDHRAGEHDGERLADPHRAGARAPPAPDRIRLDVDRLAVCRRRRRRASARLPPGRSRPPPERPPKIPSAYASQNSHVLNSQSSQFPIPNRIPVHYLIVLRLIPSAAAVPSRTPSARSRSAPDPDRAAAHRDLRLSPSARLRPATRGPAAPAFSSAPRDITRERPVSTSNASIHPAETFGSSKANAASMTIRNTSWVEFRRASSRSTSPRLVEQEIGDDRNQRRLAHEPGDRPADALALLHVLQPALVLVRVETVDDVILADPRTDGPEVREADIEGHQTEQVLEEHRRHPDRGDRRGRSRPRSARRRCRTASTATRRRRRRRWRCWAARTRARSAG